MSLSFVSLGLLYRPTGSSSPYKIICDEIVESDLYDNDRILAEIQQRARKRGNPDFKFFKNDNHNQRFIVTLEGEPFSLVGHSVTFTVKEQARDADPVIQKKNAAAGGSDDEIEMLDAANGLFVVYIEPADTEDLDADLLYVYDIEIEYLSVKTTIKAGFIHLLQDVT